ncbi:MAG TPA: tRNA lysidine(34) synthetase TilS [Abditibacteriaceae bacterium]|nr:tRNA lysidine(34) synthetase TilS [Abditibacteriaceae bacterium]
MSQPKTLEINWSLLPPRERALLAVSGGVDSMALLLAFAQADRDFIVAHVNHGLRGAESEADAEFVLQHCAGLGFSCHVERVAVPQRNGPAGEEAAREARYECLTRMARTHGCSRVATGHTASDSLETVLINWLRGAAITGLTGIRPVRPLTGDVLLVRPLLNVTRAQTQAYCRGAGWDWHEDSSNRDPRFLRNRVRGELLPLLEDLMPAGDANPERLARQTARAGAVLRADLELLDEVTASQLASLTVRETPRLIALDGLRFQELHLALQRRILRAAVVRLQGDTRDLSFELVETTRRHIADGERRAVWQWRRGLHVEWTGAMAGNRIRLWLVANQQSQSAEQRMDTDTLR